MKKIVLLRGMPGSGKSTFIKDNGLESHTLSSDKLNQMLSGVTLTPEGIKNNSIQDMEKMFTLMSTILDTRMTNQLLTFIDQTNIKPSDCNEVLRLAKLHDYKTYYIDFPMSLEEAKKRNLARSIEQVVPDYRMDKMYETLQGAPSLQKEIVKISKDEWKDELLKEFFIDISKYENIYVIGDLQGCMEPLDAFFNDHEYSKNNLYVFLGDYCDRGIENHLTLKFCLENFHKSNFIFLEGNHEYHLNCYAKGLPIKSEEFEKFTMPQLSENRIDKRQLEKFCKSLKEFVVLKDGDQEYLLSHCGLPIMPTRDEMLFLSGWEFSYKSNYQSKVDTLFAKNEKKVIQIHGHRNPERQSSLGEGNSFTLEGNVEYGGNLKIIKIKDGTMELFKYKNTKIKYALSDEIMSELTTSKYIKEKELSDGIFSYNFTREAFNKRIWDHMSMRARGLFIHKETKVIVGRSYDKFFNIDEFEHCSLESLKDSVYPVNVYLKENGFLGILAYNMINDELVFCSKSTNEGDFAGYFKKIFMDKYVDKIDQVKRMMRERRVSMVFEVVDVENDPHIIEYEKNELILLSIVKNEINFEQLDYKETSSLAKKYDFKLKELSRIFYNYDELLKFYNEAMAINFKYKDKNIEGFVFEFKNGQMVKIKCDHYAFWKKIRGFCQKIKSGKIDEMNKKIDERQKKVTDFIILNQLQELPIVEIKKLYKGKQ